MHFDFRDAKPGDPVSAKAWNEMGHAVRDGMRISGGAGVFARNSGNGLEIAVAQPDEMDFKITGGPDDNGGYEWDRVTHSSAGDHYWVDSGISGGTATGDPVYPRQYGLPKPVGRVLILIPPLTRHGNYLHIGQGWLSFGLGLRLPAGDTVYHAVRADGDSQWVFDAIGPDLSTTSDARVYVCCHSSSSSSSTSHHKCPTTECPQCANQPISCSFAAAMNNGLTPPAGHAGDCVSSSCNAVVGTYDLLHTGGCSWTVTQTGASGNIITITISNSGTGWQAELISTIPTVPCTTISFYKSSNFDCVNPLSLWTFDDIHSDCTNNNDVGLQVTP